MGTMAMRKVYIYIYIAKESRRGFLTKSGFLGGSLDGNKKGDTISINCDARARGIEIKYKSQKGNHHGMIGFVYSKAVPSLPAAERACQSRRHRAIFPLTFLSPSMLLIHDMKASSSSGTKNEESSESTVSKFAKLEVM